MSRMFNKPHRDLQDRFETRRLADRLETEDVVETLDDNAKSFVQNASMFFLSTVDHTGQPTVSYKGGFPGFVSVVSDTEIVFPSYDGNGMYYSSGNLDQHGKVGLLFIDFEKPNRLRIHGEAVIALDDKLLPDHPGAQFMIHVKVLNVFDNCPRYVHRMKIVEHSRFVPKPDQPAPYPAWKRLEYIQDVLSAEDREQTQREGGPMQMLDYLRLLKDGDV